MFTIACIQNIDKFPFFLQSSQYISIFNINDPIRVFTSKKLLTFLHINYLIFIIYNYLYRYSIDGRHIDLI